MHPSIGTTDPLAARLVARGGAAGERAGYLYLASNDDEPLGAEAIGFGEPGFYVRVVERQIANAIIIAGHYSRRVYSPSFIHLGAWIDGRLLGVIQYGYSIACRRASTIVAGTKMEEHLELNRLWLADAAPHCSESRALACSIRYLRRARPQVKWIQSFADERCGLFGAVYQAAGFTYHGEHKARFYEVDGEWYNQRLVTNSKDTGQRAAFIRANLHRAVAHDLRQFRYLKFLKPRFAKACRLRVRPFPKPGHAAGPVDEPGSPGCEAGATPAGRSPVS